MLHPEEVIKRLKLLLGYKTDLELARLLKVAPNTISSWKVRRTLRYDKIIELGNRFKIDLNDIFLNKPNSILGIDYQERNVKLISVDHQIEYFLNPERCCASSPSCFFPTEEEIDMAFQIGVDNMYPTLKVSSYVLTKKIDIKYIKVWHVYLLVIESKGIMCFRFKRFNSEGSMIFISDNEAFDSLVIHPNEIRELFCVRGAFLPNNKNIIGL